MLKNLLQNHLLPQNAPVLAEAFASLQCCQLCILRLLRIRKKPSFSNISNLSNSSIDSNIISPKNSKCPACFNLLNNHSSIQSIAEKAKDIISEYSAPKDFLVSVRIPIQLATRSRIIETCANQMINSNPESNSIMKYDTQGEGLSSSHIEIKDYLKVLIADEIAACTGLEFKSSSNLHLEVVFEHKATETEFEFIADIPKCNLNIKKKRKRKREGSLWRKMKPDEPDSIRLDGVSWTKVDQATKILSFEDLKDAKMIPIPPIVDECSVKEFSSSYSSLWLVGRYNKYERGISNSRMEFKGERLAADSMEEMIAKFSAPFFKSKSWKFLSAGREDVDVLMLGKGRPFYMEIVNPKNINADQTAINNLRDSINAEFDKRIRISDLQLVEKDAVGILKDSAATKTKSYSVVVTLSSPVTMERLAELSDIKDLALKQQTPTRVSRSRSDMVRDKIVHDMELVPIADHPLNFPEKNEFIQIRLNLKTSAGTYVKEFVHSDNGRTEPSLKSLLNCESAIVETLDVTNVDLDWPKPV